MVTMWTSSIAIPLQQAIEWYSRTTVWKWPPSWVVTTRPSGGSNPGRSCPIGSPHRRLQLVIPDLITWMPSPCWGMPCTPPSGTWRCWPGPTTMSTMRAERWEPTTEREEVHRPVRDGVLGGIHPDCTPALQADMDRLWEVCLTDADIASAPGNGLPK